MDKRKGILVCGNWIVDRIKEIDHYPESGMLIEVKNEKFSIGGGPANISIDLSKMGVGFPLVASGLIGKDSESDFILETLKEYNINIDFLERTDDDNTSYTDVMSSTSDKSRTFFHYTGTNRLLSVENIKKLPKNNAKIFYLAYLFLLDGLEKENSEFGYAAAEVLSIMKDRGYLNVVDMVSKSSGSPDIVISSLKYIDYLVVNEVETGFISGLKIRKDDGTIDKDILIEAGKKIIDMGLQQCLVVHFPEGAFAIKADCDWFYEPSFKKDSARIKGSNGAGDAFCAGFLYSLHEGIEMKTALKIGSASSWFNLDDSTTTGGAVKIDKILEFIKTAEVNN
jgi:sugar/nucleoside kinase (ribokinase family)